MADGISFGQFNIFGGTVREDGPYVCVVENRSPGEARADLYVVIEPAQPGSEAVCAELLRLIASQFGRPQYSVTGNLLQCLRAAQEHLRALNKTATDHQTAAGASCLAVRGNVAYLAQIGPSVAYLRHDGRLRMFQPLEPEERSPLGTTLACAPAFNRLDLARGDTVLLVTSRFHSLINDEVAEQLLSLPPADALPEIYTVARNEREFSALYLSVTGQLQTSDMSPAGLDTDDTPHSGMSFDTSFDTAHVAPDLEGPPLQGWATAFDGAPAADVLRTQRRRLDRINDRRSLSVPRPALYAIAVVVVLGLTGWVGMPRLLKAGQQDRFSALMQDAQKQEAAATGADDPAQKRSLLEQAQGDVVEARTLRPNAPELLSVQAQALSALQTLDQVRQVPSSRTVADLTTTQVAPRSLLQLAAIPSLYLLDASSGTVYSFGHGGSSDAAVAAFAAGTIVEGIQAGKAVQIASRPVTGSAPGLLYILDSNRRLFSLDDSGTVRAVGLNNAASWKSVNALAVNGNDFYVLDNEAGQIWHYTLNGGAFTDAPSPLLVKADLHDASGLSATTAIYVSTVNGGLFRVRDGRLEEVKIDGIDHRLVSPQPPVYDASTGLQYIADLGNQRVVASQGADVYAFQYSGAVLQGLRAIALDPSAGLLYALSVQKLYAIPLR